MKRPMQITFAILLVAFVWVGCGQDEGPVGPSGESALQPAAKVTGLARAIEVQDRNTERLMALAGVVGTATGLRADGRPAVVVLTEAPGVAGIAQALDGVPVIVKVTGEIRALKKPDNPGGGKDKSRIDPTARFDRPVPIGVSTGHPAITAGTIGCRVVDGAGNVYALSNNHVYADENLAGIGDAVIQPGTYDGGSSPADDIGALADFEPIIFSTSANNVIDAAIASSTELLLGRATPSDGYGTPQSVHASPAVGLKVTKYGRTTGQTEAEITAINATVDVGYSSGTARFIDQMVIGSAGFSDGGDSGSLIVVVDETRSGRGKNRTIVEGPDHLKPVGLLYAGSVSATIANPIGTVLDRFGVTVDGE